MSAGSFPSPKARREARMKAERRKLAMEENPTLPKPCECDKPIPLPPEDFMGPRCLRCARSLP